MRFRNVCCALGEVAINYEIPLFFRTWIIRILLNVCRDIRRRQQSIIKMDSYVVEKMPADSDVPRDASRLLHDALLRLEERLRLPIILYYMEGLSISEIATLLRLPQGTVKSRLYRARQLLRIDLENEEMISCGV